MAIKVEKEDKSKKILQFEYSVLLNIQSEWVSHFRFKARVQNIRLRHESRPYLVKLHRDATDGEESSESQEEHEATMDESNRCECVVVDVGGDLAAAWRRLYSSRYKTIKLCDGIVWQEEWCVHGGFRPC